MFIDTHTHLSYNEGINPNIYIKNSIDAGVKYIIVSCCNMESIKEGLELIKQFPNIFLSIGIHPEYTASYTDSDLEYIYNIALNNKRVVSIGEIGLDYHYGDSNKDKQKELFLKQIDIAKKLNLPVQIHTRDAVQETFDILETSGVIGDIHCYSGSVEMAEKYVKLGFYLGIGGVVTFNNTKLYQVIEKVGINHILLETDSPYLAPVPYRGKINESKYIPVIADKIASILNIDVNNVGEITSKNACKVFDLDIKM